MFHTQIVFNDDEKSLHIEDPSGNTWDMDGQGNIAVNAPKNMTITVGENMEVTVSKNITTNIGQDIITKVGNNMIETIIKDYSLKVTNFGEEILDSKVSKITNSLIMTAGDANIQTLKDDFKIRGMKLVTIFLGKIENSEDVYITDKGTFDKIKNKEEVEGSKIIAFTKKYKINNDQLLDRAHWSYGEVGGTMPDQLANSLNNRSKMLGEEQMYAGMTTKSRKDPDNQITPTRQRKIYFEQSIIDSKETVNINYKDFKILFKDQIKANAKEKIESSKEKFKIKEIKNVISSNIKVISGEIKDDLDGAAFWISGSTGETYSLNNSKLGTTVTKVSQKSAYGYLATHCFFNFKKANEKKNTIVYMKEIKLEQPLLK